jgi:DNA invertase Pin-like site-specific DNA recombinase
VTQQSTTLRSGEQEEDELAALEGLAETVEENAREERLLARRIRQLRAGRAAGRSWHSLLDREGPPPVLELSSRILRRATDASVVLRRRLAAGLRAEGGTLPAIARRFGVTHQRISTLLRNGTSNGDRPPR